MVIIHSSVKKHTSRTLNSVTRKISEGSVGKMISIPTPLLPMK